MRAFSYAWSLPVTWQRRRSHQSIRCIRKPHVTRKLSGYVFYRTGVITGWKFYIAGMIFDLFCSCDFDLDRWPSHTNLTCIPWRYTGFANMNFLRHGFRKLLSTERETDTIEVIYHSASRVVKTVYAAPKTKSLCAAVKQINAPPQTPKARKTVRRNEAVSMFNIRGPTTVNTRDHIGYYKENLKRHGGFLHSLPRPSFLSFLPLSLPAL